MKNDVFLGLPDISYDPDCFIGDGFDYTPIAAKYIEN